MCDTYRTGPASAPRIEWFNKVGVWLDHRTKRIGIEDEDGVITWYSSDLTIIEITDALDEEMAGPGGSGDEGLGQSFRVYK